HGFTFWLSPIRPSQSTTYICRARKSRGGHVLATSTGAMTTPARSNTPRRRIVWGRVVLAATFLFGLTAVGFAAPGPRGPATSVAGGPGSQVKAYKLDDELTRRSNAGTAQQLSSVIVTLVPGGQLPAEFRRYARAGKLDIINGLVLDVPNGVL